MLLGFGARIFPFRGLKARDVIAWVGASQTSAGPGSTPRGYPEPSMGDTSCFPISTPLQRGVARTSRSPTAVSTASRSRILQEASLPHPVHPVSFPHIPHPASRKPCPLLFSLLNPVTRKSLLYNAKNALASHPFVCHHCVVGGGLHREAASRMSAMACGDGGPGPAQAGNGLFDIAPCRSERV
jgi:hypothetical protein